MSQKELADKIGVPDDTIGNICRGKTRMKPARKALIAAALEISVVDLTAQVFHLGGIEGNQPTGPLLTTIDTRAVMHPGGPPGQGITKSTEGPAPGFNPPGAFEDRQSHPKVGRRLFPVVGAAGAAQFPFADGHIQFDPEDFEEFSDDLYIERPQRFVIVVKGDSMKRRLFHEDFVLVHPDPEAHKTKVGFLVVVWQRGVGFLVKTLRARQGKFILHPENPDFEDIEIDPAAFESDQNDPEWMMIGYPVGRKRKKGKKDYLEEGAPDGMRPGIPWED